MGFLGSSSNTPEASVQHQDICCESRLCYFNEVSFCNTQLGSLLVECLPGPLLVLGSIPRKYPTLGVHKMYNILWTPICDIASINTHILQELTLEGCYPYPPTILLIARTLLQKYFLYCLKITIFSPTN